MQMVYGARAAARVVMLCLTFSSVMILFRSHALGYTLIAIYRYGLWNN